MPSWLKTALLFLLVCVLFVGIVLVGIDVLEKPEPVAGTSLPAKEEPCFSAEALAALTDTGGNAVTYVTVREGDPLPTSAVPRTDTLLFCETTGDAKHLDVKKFSKFYESALSAFNALTGISTPVCTPSQKDAALSVPPTAFGSCSFSASQTGRAQTWSFDTADGSALVLSGKTLSFPSDLSGEALLTALVSFRPAFASLCGKELPDGKVLREDDGLTVYLYNVTSHPVSAYAVIPPYDRLEIRFSLSPDESTLLGDGLTFTKLRGSPYKATATLEKVPLATAEEWLRGGCLFGGHACPLCMEKDPFAALLRYDTVRLEYLFCRDADGEPTVALPFYAFYRKASEQDGTVTYARALVPAFAVEEMTEFFASQTKVHG